MFKTNRQSRVSNRSFKPQGRQRFESRVFESLAILDLDRDFAHLSFSPTKVLNNFTRFSFSFEVHSEQEQLLPILSSCFHAFDVNTGEMLPICLQICSYKIIAFGIFHLEGHSSRRKCCQFSSHFSNFDWDAV